MASPTINSINDQVGMALAYLSYPLEKDPALTPLDMGYGDGDLLNRQFPKAWEEVFV